MPIEWNDSLKSGISVIDEQHQDLIIMLNRLHRLRCGKECFYDAFSELENYANIHFKTEEDIMISLNYPEYKTHKICHDKFVDALIQYAKQLEDAANITELGEEIIKFAENWIIEHYSNEDVELVKYLKGN